jgi:hypothetical protein
VPSGVPGARSLRAGVPSGVPGARSLRAGVPSGVWAAASIEKREFGSSRFGIRDSPRRFWLRDDFLETPEADSRELKA